jgi:hypothetical protein
MKKALLLVLALFGSLGSITFDRPLYAANLYQGRVVDEETGQPLVGAAVTVVWYRTPAVHMERTLYFQSVQDTETDCQGKFSLLASPGTDGTGIAGNSICSASPTGERLGRRYERCVE